jgi:ADP-heptose:LPS heptosyltransferase
VAALEPLLAKAGAQLHSLQQSTNRDDQAWLQRHAIVDLAPRINDFSDSAAAISALDLVISVDTATAHLCGALGTPVWVLLGHAADWRYLRNRDDSPWYPSMRLFRQKRRGDWHGLIHRVADALGEEFQI